MTGTTTYGDNTSIKQRGSENGNRFSPTGVEELTRSGQLVSLLDPRPDQIRMSDIATSLAAQVRFNGHCPLQPTIAQHSLAVEYIAGELMRRRNHPYVPSARYLAPRSLSRAALCHDAAEYLVGDNIGAVKKLMRQPTVLHDGLANSFDKIEDRVQAAVVTRFDCSDEGWEGIIHEADCIACAYEMSRGDWCLEARPPQWARESAALRRCYRPHIVDDFHDGGAHDFIVRAAQLGMAD